MNPRTVISLMITVVACALIAGAMTSGSPTGQRGLISGGGGVAGPGSGQLSLELPTPGCQPDDQIIVEVWMRDIVGTNVTGFQAFVEYNTSILTFRCDNSDYTNIPFPLHITPICEADNGHPETLWLDGSVALDDPNGTNQDALLATLVFDVDQECAATSLWFKHNEPFFTELSFQGTPIATGLTNTPVFKLDDTPPKIGPVEDIQLNADAGGCNATIDLQPPDVWDNCTGNPTLECTRSDNLPCTDPFPCGADPGVPGVPITVTWTATDECGNQSSAEQLVTVDCFNEVAIVIELVGVCQPCERCIHFVADDCGVTADFTLSFVDHDGDDSNCDGLDDFTGNPATPVRTVDATITVGCGLWTFLCAKDEQHTLYETTNLSIVGTQYVGNTVLSLRGGDTDNDSDVDINDVTFLINQYGEPCKPGSCPWDITKTRDADFNCNCLTDLPDYIILSQQWLQFTTCDCTTGPGGLNVGSIVADGSFLPQEVRVSMPASELPDKVAARVDLNRDGLVDYKDVRIFEEQNGLPNTLSLLIEATQLMVEAAEEKE